jgi:hypothetical protein
MKLIFFIVWLAIVGQFAIWTFAPDKPREAEASVGDGQPYGYLESYHVESREGMRTSAMATLDQPWSSRCGEARKSFISGVSGYYWQRKNQYERYAETHGKPGADYIARAWSSSEDVRIDRLTREAYANGYMRPSDFTGYARDLIGEIVKDERVTGKGCAG